MQEKEIKTHIKNAIAEDTPDCFEKIISIPLEPARPYTPNSKCSPRLHSFYTKLLVGLATCAACLLFIIGIPLFRNNQVYTVIELDVNPSISLSVNAANKVLSATSLNEDANTILENLSLSDQSLDKAVNLIIVSFVENGYLNNNTNTILVTIENKKDNFADDLKEQLTTDITTTLQERNITGTVLTQYMKEDKEVKQLAKQYEISVGKASFVKTMAAENPDWSVGQLAELNVNELASKASDANIDLERALEQKQKQDTAKAKNTPVSPHSEPSAPPSTKPQENTISSKSTEQKNTDNAPFQKNNLSKKPKDKTSVLEKNTEPTTEPQNKLSPNNKHLPEDNFPKENKDQKRKWNEQEKNFPKPNLTKSEEDEKDNEDNGYDNEEDNDEQDTDDKNDNEEYDDDKDSDQDKTNPFFPRENEKGKKDKKHE